MLNKFTKITLCLSTALLVLSANDLFAATGLKDGIPPTPFVLKGPADKFKLTAPNLGGDYYSIKCTVNNKTFNNVLQLSIGSGSYCGQITSDTPTVSMDHVIPSPNVQTKTGLIEISLQIENPADTAIMGTCSITEEPSS